jgi:hypothetical protein
VTVTPATVKVAKKDRAFLNGLSTSLNQRRKEVKERYMAPVVAFEAMVKELDAPIREASTAIDVQVKAFEDEAREAKRAELKKHYEEYAPIMVDAVPFERIFDAKWLLAACDLMRGFDEIEARVNRIAVDEAALDDLGLAHPIEAKAEYFATLDLSRAIARSKELDAQVERARVLEEQKAAFAAEVAPPAPEPVAAPAPAPEPAPAPAEEARDWTLTLTCTRSQLDAAIAAIAALGIRGVAR